MNTQLTPEDIAYCISRGIVSKYEVDCLKAIARMDNPGPYHVRMRDSINNKLKLYHGISAKANTSKQRIEKLNENMRAAKNRMLTSLRSLYEKQVEEPTFALS